MKQSACCYLETYWFEQRVKFDSSIRMTFGVGFHACPIMIRITQYKKRVRYDHHDHQGKSVLT